MKISAATRDDVYYVALNMRGCDYEELSELYHADTPSALAEMIAERLGGRIDTYLVSDRGAPVAVAGAIEHRPNVLTLSFFATDGFNSVAIPLTRFIKQRFFPPLIAAGVHRIECLSSENHSRAHRWLRSLGLTQESPPLAGFGKTGTPFISFAWTAAHVR